MACRYVYGLGTLRHVCPRSRVCLIPTRRAGLSSTCAWMTCRKALRSLLDPPVLSACCLQHHPGPCSLPAVPVKRARLREVSVVSTTTFPWLFEALIHTHSRLWTLYAHLRYLVLSLGGSSCKFSCCSCLSVILLIWTVLVVSMFALRHAHMPKTHALTRAGRTITSNVPRLMSRCSESARYSR